MIHAVMKVMMDYVVSAVLVSIVLRLYACFRYSFAFLPFS